MPKITITTDGGSRSNPGKSACGFVIYQVNNFVSVNSGTFNLKELINTNNILIHQEGFYLGIQTNNYAEWMGLLKALEWLSNNYDLSQVELQILADSNLVIQQLLRKWKIKDLNLQKIAIEVFRYTSQIDNLIASHIYREYNKEADALVNQVLDNL